MVSLRFPLHYVYTVTDMAAMTEFPGILPAADAPAAPPRHIVFLAYEGVSLLDLAGPLEAFRVAATFAGEADDPRLYQCTVASAGGGPVMTADGVALVTECVGALDDRPIDTIVAPGAFRVEDAVGDRALIDWVATQADSCRRICSVCIGSFLLAAAGVLDGRRATTHWLHCDDLAARFPSITVEPDSIFVRDGAVWTSAGVTTGIDLALALIEDDAGGQTAMAVARMLVVYLKRAGGQSQYSALLGEQAAAASGPFDELERWIAENLTADLRIEALARRMHMHPRSFARVYAASRARTPAKAVEAIRVDSARRLLETTTDQIEGIAAACGFRNEEQLRSAFRRTLGVTPRDYRRRFAPERSG